MTKADLKTGMIVTCRNGNEYTVNLKKGEFRRIGGFMMISSYNDDLTHNLRDEISTKYDIVSVSGILWQRSCEHEYVCAKCGEKMEKPPTLQS